MNKMLLNYKLVKKGITIVEILVVVLIVSILALILFLFFDDESINARNAVRIDAMGKVRDAMFLYQHEEGTFPDAGSNEQLILYIDNQEPGDSGYNKYSEGDIIYSKNSNLDKTLGGGKFIKKLSGFLEDPTSVSGNKIFYKYGVNYSGFYGEEKFVGNKFEIATVLERVGGGYENYVLNNFIQLKGDTY